jgi:hypothetical protein
MDSDHKKFVIFALVFPFASLMLLFLLNYVVDPFGINGRFNLGLNKAVVSLPSNQRLYKIISFTENPSRNIILGDSRMDSLSVIKIRQFSGEPYFNFSYGGGTADEIIETFWFAARRFKLKNVYIGMNFNLYNQFNARNLVHEALDINNHREQYYLSFFTTKVSVYNLYYKLFHINPVNEKPRMKKAEFWAKQLREVSFFYQHYAYPSRTYRELNRIKNYCRRNRINLVFIIPPTHVDLQNKVGDYFLNKEYVRYKQDLASISKVIDFEYPNQWTRDATLFLDPYHGGDFIKKELVKEIWGRKLFIGKVL